MAVGNEHVSLDEHETIKELNVVLNFLVKNIWEEDVLLLL